MKIILDIYIALLYLINIMTKKELNELRSKLEVYMGENDFTLDDIAEKVGRNRMTIHRFLKGAIEPRHQTLYRIKKLTAKV
jgi:DNA-binding phage protein